MLKVLRALAIALVATAIVLGLAWWLGGQGFGKEKTAVAFLEQFCGDEMLKAYQATSKGYTSFVTMREFGRTREYYVNLLGTFVGVDEVVEERQDEPSTGHITLRLEFEKGEALGWFELAREDDTWKIGNFSLDVPRDRVDKPQVADPRRFTEGLMAVWASGNATDVWQQFEFPLRERMAKAAFEADTEDALESLGELESVEESAFEQPEAERAALRHALKFEKGTCHVETDLVWRGSRWTVTRFDVQTPD